MRCFFNTSDVCCWTAHPNYSQVSTSWLVAADSAEEFQNKPDPFFPLLFILSLKAAGPLASKEPHIPSSHLHVWHCLQCYWGGSKALLSPWAQNFTSVLCPDLDFPLWKQLQILNPQCEKNWINCLECVPCFWSLLWKTKNHNSPSKHFHVVDTAWTASKA